MENKAHALAAGAFVIGLIGAVIALIIWFTRDDTVRNVYELSTSTAVSGLQPQATVRYRGIAVGKVTSIGFDPKVRGNVRVLISVDERVPLTTSSFATLSYQGVTGIAFVALDDNGESKVALAPDNANPPRIPLKPSVLASLQERGEEIIDQVNQATVRINTLLGDGNQQKVTQALDNIAQAAASANALTQQLDKTVREDLGPSLKAMPALIGSTRESLVTVKAAASNVSRAANSFNSTVSRLNEKDGVLDRLATGTQGLGQAVDAFNGSTLPRVNRVADDTSRAVRRLGRAAESINDNPQSLLFGSGGVAPGPGEPGFSPPAAAGGPR